MFALRVFNICEFYVDIKLKKKHYWLLSINLKSQRTTHNGDQFHCWKFYHHFLFKGPMVYSRPVPAPWTASALRYYSSRPSNWPFLRYFFDKPSQNNQAPSSPPKKNYVKTLFLFSSACLISPCFLMYLQITMIKIVTTAMQTIKPIISICLAVFSAKIEKNSEKWDQITPWHVAVGIVWVVVRPRCVGLLLLEDCGLAFLLGKNYGAESGTQRCNRDYRLEKQGVHSEIRIYLCFRVAGSFWVGNL